MWAFSLFLHCYTMLNIRISPSFGNLCSQESPNIHSNIMKNVMNLLDPTYDCFRYLPSSNCCKSDTLTTLSTLDYTTGLSFSSKTSLLYHFLSLCFSNKLHLGISSLLWISFTVDLVYIFSITYQIMTCDIN